MSSLESTARTPLPAVHDSGGTRSISPSRRGSLTQEAVLVQSERAPFSARALSPVRLVVRGGGGNKNGKTRCKRLPHEASSWRERATST